MSNILKAELKKELNNVGFKDTSMNDKLVTAIAKAVQTYLNGNVEANISGGSSSGSHKLVAK